eukprot:scaffold24657_cov129-Isochrysis_galbana.AAC.2
MVRKKLPWRTRAATTSPSNGSASTCHLSVGTSVTALLPVDIRDRIDSRPRIPSGNDTLAPHTRTTACGLAGCATFDVADKTVSVSFVDVRPSKKWASCRAVGNSKISVLGSLMLLPHSCCSLFTSSTALKESNPASISGASASTEPPMV